MHITSKRHRLAAKWNPRERCMEADLGPRTSGATLSWLFDNVFTKEVCAELQARGFDLKTLRFRIDRTPEAIAEYERSAGAPREGG